MHAMTSANTNTTMVGWMGGSNDRGTFDIIWSSTVTISLCTWVSTYPNVSKPNARLYHVFLDKLWLAMMGLVGPDLLFIIALGQLSKAKRGVQLIRQSVKFPDSIKWRYKYSFFLDMGGIFLTGPDFPDGFPIDTEQLHYLVMHNYIDCPDMEKMDIDERNSQDTLSRLITGWQVFWFFIVAMRRVSLGLPITSLELTALTFSGVMIGTFISWWHKPSIRSPRYITTRNGTPIQTIRETAQQTTHPGLPDDWNRSPLDFISRRPFVVDYHWAYFRSWFEWIPWLPMARPLVGTPWDSFPSDEWHPATMDRWILALGTAVWFGYSSAFLFSWNFHFPTYAELLLWRSVALYVSVYTFICCGWYVLEAYKWHRQWRHETPGIPARSTTMLSSAGTATDVASSQDTPEIDLEARSSTKSMAARGYDTLTYPVTWFELVATVLYVLGRVVIYVEDFVALRSQPANIYISVDLQSFLPSVT